MINLCNKSSRLGNELKPLLAYKIGLDLDFKCNIKVFDLQCREQYKLKVYLQDLFTRCILTLSQTFTRSIYARRAYQSCYYCCQRPTQRWRCQSKSFSRTNVKQDPLVKYVVVSTESIRVLDENPLYQIFFNVSSRLQDYGYHFQNT